MDDEDPRAVQRLPGTYMSDPRNSRVQVVHTANDASIPCVQKQHSRQDGGDVQLHARVGPSSYLVGTERRSDRRCLTASL